LKIYYFVGGMPEAVRQYAEDKDLNKVRNIQEEILSAYTIDFSKYTTKTEAAGRHDQCSAKGHH
jgi:uncharacterized protein